MTWESILKETSKEYIDNYVKQTKQGLYDMLLPTWEDEPLLLKKHIEEMFTKLMEMVLGGSAQTQYIKYKYGDEE